MLDKSKTFAWKTDIYKPVSLTDLIVHKIFETNSSLHVK